MITAGRATLAVREGRTLDDGRAAYHITAEVKPTEPLAQDPLSALYLLRTMAFTKTQSISIPMVNNGKNYRIRVRVGDREVVTTGVGRMSSWRLTSVV